MDKYEQIAIWIKEIEEMQGSKIEVNNDTPSSTTFNLDNKISVIRLGGMTLDAAYYYLEGEHERSKRRFEKEDSMKPFDFNKFKKLD